MTTIREHAEAIRRGHSGCGNCEHGFLCPEVEHAQAILDILDNSREMTEKETIITVERPGPDDPPNAPVIKHINVEAYKARVVRDDG